MTAVAPASTVDRPRMLAEPEPPAGRRWVRRVAVAVVLAPFVVVALRLWLRRNDGYVPFADYALFEMQLRDIPNHLPLLGVYSRFGFNHPGPLEAYLVGAVYWLTGRHSLSMWIGGAALNAAACVTVVVIGFRRLGQAGGVLTTGVLVLYLVYLGPLGMSDPWNPIIAILPFLAFVFCCWDAWPGGRWVWLGVIGAGTFVMQAHLGFAVPVVALGGLTVGVRAWGLRRKWRVAAWRAGPVAVGGLVLGAVLWTPPLYQQLTGSPGNFSQLIEYATTSRPGAHTWRESAALASREVVSPIGNLLAFPRFDIIMQWPQQMRVLVGLGALMILGSAVVAIMRRRREVLSLYLLGGIGWLLAVAQCTRMEGPLWPYLTAWISSFFVVFGVAMVGTWLPELRRVVPSASPRVHRVLAASVLGLSALALLVSASWAPWPSPDQRSVVGPILAALEGRLPSDGPVLIDDGGRPVVFELTTLDGMLVRQGIDVRANNALALQFGNRVIGTEQPVLVLDLHVIDPDQPPPAIPGRMLFAAGGRLALYQPI